MRFLTARGRAGGRHNVATQARQEGSALAKAPSGYVNAIHLGGLPLINDSLVKHLSKTADLTRDDDEREGLIEGAVASL